MSTVKVTFKNRLLVQMKVWRYDGHLRNPFSYLQYQRDIHEFKFGFSAVKNKLPCHYAHIIA
jgi:hypothetical protein